MLDDSSVKLFGKWSSFRLDIKSNRKSHFQIENLTKNLAINTRSSEKSVKYFDTSTTFFCTMDISNFQKDATISISIA